MPTEAKQQRLQFEIWQLQKPPKVVELLREIGRGKVDEIAQEALLECLNNSVSQRFSPGHRYLDRLLKAVILSAENEEDALIEDLVVFHKSILLQPPKAATAWDLSACWCYKTYSYGAGLTGTVKCDQERSYGTGHVEGLITLHVSQNLIKGSTGCHEWEAGFLLSEFILSHADLFRGKRCCEVGCGPGTAGVSLQRVGASSILLTDGDEDTLLNCRHNLSINDMLTQDHDNASPSLSKGVETALLRWEDGGSLDADILLGADLLYDPGSYRVLIQLIGSSLKDKKAAEPKEMILATTVRNEASFASFLELIADSGLHAELLGDGNLQCLGVRFRHHLELDRRRHSILLHKITAIM